MPQCTQNLINQHLMDINPILAGWVADWKSSPMWHEPKYCMTLYYIRRGHLTLVRKDGEYPVHEGQCFFVPFEDHDSYTVGQPGETYDFSWVGFTGSLSHRFAEVTAPLDVSETQLVNLKNLREFDTHTPYGLASDLLLLRADLLDANEPKPDYVQYVIDYIQEAYMLPITVESLAAQVGLDRSYLSRLFKKRTGTTLQSHLQYVRFLEAKQMLLQGCSVKEAAYKAGFGDDKTFHKIFVQKEGFSPTVWKKCVLNNLATLQVHWPEQKTTDK